MTKKTWLDSAPVPFDLIGWAEAHRYRWTFEESHEAEMDPNERHERNWFAQVACQRGTIYVQGADTLIAYVTTGRAKSDLLGLGATIHQRGDNETALRFPAALLSAVARVLRPRQRRTVAPEVGAVGAARLAAYRDTQAGRQFLAAGATQSPRMAHGASNARPRAGDARNAA